MTFRSTQPPPVWPANTLVRVDTPEHAAVTRVAGYRFDEVCAGMGTEELTLYNGLVLRREFTHARDQYDPWWIGQEPMMVQPYDLLVEPAHRV